MTIVKNEVVFKDTDFGKTVIIFDNNGEPARIMDYDVWLDRCQQFGVDENTDNLLDILNSGFDISNPTAHISVPASTIRRAVW